MSSLINDMYHLALIWIKMSLFILVIGTIVRFLVTKVMTVLWQISGPVVSSFMF